MKMMNEIEKCQCVCGSMAILYKIRNMNTGEQYYWGKCEKCERSKRFDGYEKEKIHQNFIKCFSKIKWVK